MQSARNGFFMSIRRGFGSIRKLPSGRYQLVFANPNGIKQAARTTFQTKAEAEFEVRRIYAAVRSETWQVDETPQAGDLNPKTIALQELATHRRGQQVSSTENPIKP